MTWHAQRGATVLFGPEAKIFADATDQICDEIRSSAVDEGSQLYYGPSSFNRMTRTQQAASLELVVNALFKESLDPFPLVAWSEATLAAILGVVQGSIHIEIDEGESSELQIQLDLLTDGEISPEKKDWDTHDEWDLTFECYESQFLWDRDFEYDGFMDMAPEAARLVGSMMGIDDDYHSTIPPDLKSDDELGNCLERISGVFRNFF